ncbi:MAG: MobF family relaxase [Thermoguttaceae bacterium]|jgi:conjugative relaxase-like TrwC/TraI family protein
MLRINQNNSAAGAMSYYTTADYYTEGQELVGQWRGEAAKRLGLAGTVQKETWDALCNNRHPATGDTLTLRHKQHRRVGYDFTFDVPKSVSVLYSLTKDERILDAFRESVNETMRDMESEMQTRVRKDGENGKRTTGNMLWGEYVHFTSRPVGGVPDPHLHAHCFVHNVTWDKKETAWKAGEFADLKRDAPYFEAKFHSRMARRLAGLGIAVERTKTGWEIADVPKSAVRKFSRRTALIEEEAKRKGIVDAAAKSELGAKTREHKKKDLTFDELRAEWSARLSASERVAIAEVGNRVGGNAIGEDAKAPLVAVRHATEHWFERKSVVPERTLLTEAMKHAVGKAGPEAVEAAYERQELVVGDRDGQRMATTRDVLKEEMRMLAFARNGRGTEAKLSGKPHAFTRDWLNEGQRRAVRHVLESRDKVVLIRGAAGVGKTAMMQEAVEAIQNGGKRVFTFAPSADASRGVLRSEGFGNADTVARLLIDERLHDKLKGQVIWMDEAGLLGTKTMASVFDLAERIDARVILSGDRYQHGSVERGAALRLLEVEAGLVPAEIKDIQRQKGAYKQAVQALSDGRTEDGFRQLDAMGWVREVADDDRCRVLARDYVATVAAGKSALVVSPTHREGERITADIRAELKKLGRVNGEERPVLQLHNANLTEAQRADELNYLPGDVLEFHQNAKGFHKGQRVAVGSTELPLDQAARFQAFNASELRLAPGDMVRITKNGLTADGEHRLNNGARYMVTGFNPSGDIVLDNGWAVSKDFGHLAYGYVATSHASQGKTVDRVLIGQSAESFPASSREQFYVSISRAREKATVYTNDRHALLAAVSRSDDRLAATEFVNKRERVSVLQRQESMALASPEPATRHRDGVEHVR